MSRLEVDVKSLQKLIWARVTKAQKSLTDLESHAERTVRKWVAKGVTNEGKRQVENLVRDVRTTVESSDLVKNFKRSNLYDVALKAKDELEKKVAQAQEKVFEVLNVPTMDDLDRLSKKVDDLGKKIRTSNSKKK